MPYTLRLFYADAPLNSVAEAEACIARDFNQKPPGHLLGRFRSMQASMLANCPDLSEFDPAANRPDNAWPIGLPAVFDTSVYSFCANAPLLQQGLMGLLAEMIAQLGLHLFDPQTGELYRPDRQVIDRNGALRAPPPMAVPEPVRATLITAEQCTGIVQPLRQSLHDRLAAHGFQPRESDRHGVIRRVDRIAQNLQVTGTHRHEGVATYGRWALFAPEVTEQWLPAVASAFERFFNAYQKTMGGRVDPFWVYSEDLLGEAGRTYGQFAFPCFQTREPLARWFQHFGDHLIDKELPVLDGIGTPRALAAILLTDRLRWRLEKGSGPQVVEIFGLLVLAYAFDRGNFDRWHQSLRAINSIRARGQGWENAVALVDGLAEYLASSAFDPTAIGGSPRS